MKGDQGFRADCRAAGDSHPGRPGFLDPNDGHYGPDYAYPSDGAIAAGVIQVDEGRGDRADAAASIADALNSISLGQLVIPLYLLGIAGSASLVVFLAWKGGI